MKYNLRFTAVVAAIFLVIAFAGCERDGGNDGNVPATPKNTPQATPTATAQGGVITPQATPQVTPQATPVVRIPPRREPAVGQARTTIDGDVTPSSVLVENDHTPQREVVSAVRALCEPYFFVHWNNQLRSVFLRTKTPPYKWSEVRGQLVLVNNKAYASPQFIAAATGWEQNVSWDELSQELSIEYSTEYSSIKYVPSKDSTE